MHDEQRKIGISNLPRKWYHSRPLNPTISKVKPVSELGSYNKSIEDIFRNNLKIESNPMSIETLFTGRLRNRITYDPYYQRNYVWDKQKATYFIESILIGTEIPPLIFFNGGGQIEVIDGRQRFQTIDRFIKGEFELVSRGLFSLKSLKGLKYERLSDSIKNTFLDTALRVIEFAIVASNEISEVQEDTVKKEVFRRYNSGITPLRKSEIEKAEYIDNNVTKFFREQLIANKDEFKGVVRIVASERKQSRIAEPRLIDDIMIDIRKFLVLHEVPIRYYLTASGKEVAKIIYEDFSERADPVEVYQGFISKIETLTAYHETVSTQSPSNNHYLYETLYWTLAILEKEGIDCSKVSDPDFINNFKDYVKDQSHVYDAESQVFQAVTIARFEATLNYFAHIFNRTNLEDIYVSNNVRRLSVNQYRSDDSPPASINDDTIHRLNKPDAQTITVENLNNRMNRRRFLVRPPYQRYESISSVKASAIIESMLLGIKLPPIFVFNRDDSVMEVIDGQQRVLAIFGFMNLEFLDERGEWTRSAKNGFKLRNLRILKELNGKAFEDLEVPLQDKLWDFNLYQVNIDEKLNPDFEPVDLFIRLNNKPYPIKDNTFEMWNSYIDKNIIQNIKDKTEQYKKWFYLRNDNRRMDNENLYTTFAYLEYQKTDEQPTNVLEFFTRSKRVNSRIRSTVNITRLLELVSHDDKERQKFIKGIRATESFIKRKVKPLLIDNNVTDDVDKHLNKELASMFDTERRTRNQFYVLWYALSRINPAMILEHRDTLRSRISQILRFIANTEDVSEENAIEVFHRLVSSILEDHSPDARNLKLTHEEISSRILSQNNVCPLCGKSMFIGEDVEVDHMHPISVGGSDTLDNVQIVHWICNRKKGNDVL